EHALAERAQGWRSGVDGVSAYRRHRKGELSELQQLAGAPLLEAPRVGGVRKEERGPAAGAALGARQVMGGHKVARAGIEQAAPRFSANRARIPSLPESPCDRAGSARPAAT